VRLVLRPGGSGIGNTSRVPGRNRYTSWYTKDEGCISLALFRFEKLSRMLEKNGWTHDRSHGSHRYFTKPRHPLFGVAVVGKGVKQGYVDKAEKLIQKCKSGHCSHCEAAR